MRHLAANGLAESHVRGGTKVVAPAAALKAAGSLSPPPSDSNELTSGETNADPSSHTATNRREAVPSIPRLALVTINLELFPYLPLFLLPAFSPLCWGTFLASSGQSHTRAIGDQEVLFISHCLWLAHDHED